MKTSVPARPFFLCCVAFAVLSVCVLTTFAIVNASVWYDEVYSLRLTEMSASGLLNQIQNDAHPPLYYLTLRGFVLGVRALFPNADAVVSAKLFSMIPLLLLCVFAATRVRAEFGEAVAGCFLLAVSGMA